MIYNTTEAEILNKLIGPVNEDESFIIKKNIDCFLHPQVSLFVPSSGYCKYAISPSHTHPAYSFIYYFQPVNDFIVEGRRVSYELTESRCLSSMSPDIPHQEIEEDTFQSYIAILIEAELFHRIILQYTETVPVFRGEIFVPHPELLGMLRCFMLEAQAGVNANSELLDNLAPVIAHLIVRSVVIDVHQTMPLYDRFEVDRAIAYMNSHFSEKITMEDLAEKVNLSTGHFSKVFKMVTGNTPIDFLNILRLQKARSRLINYTDNITKIALDCGFSTSSYFSSCFIEKYKMTPSAYRQNFQNNNNA